MQLTVIIPAHNRVGLLYEAICSVFKQKLDSCEILVCDDGSTEDIASACKAFADKAYDVIHSRTEENMGAQIARNRGMDLARGDFLLFLDSDDVLATNGLGPLIQSLVADPSIDYVYGRVFRANEKLEPRIASRPVGEPFSDEPYEVAGYHWHTMGALYRRSYLDIVGPWNVDMTGSQDWEYQARVKLAEGKRKFINCVVGYWRQHEIDRVGALEFRADYVRSVMVACNVVLKIAREKNCCDSALERRLAKRLVVHALEWGANACFENRKECLLQAKEGCTFNSFFKSLITCIIYTPPILDKFILRCVTGHPAK